jgi:hypothetical protein
MFNKNVFTQTDVVADLIKGINEADFKAKMEALRGNQHKIDKNKNGKVDAHDFKLLRGEKKVNEEEVEEAAESPFTSWKKPRQPEPSGGSGVKQGSRYGGSKQKEKPEHDDEKVKKEEIDPKKVTTDTLAGTAKGKTGNPFAPKKVMMDVAGNVKEETEDLEEAKFDAMKHIAKDKQTPAIKAAAKLVKPTSYADRAALNKAGGVKDDRGPRGVTQEEVEQMYERELSKDETAEKERIVKGMKKNLAGFKVRYGKDAKSVMHATATKSAKKD